MSGRPASAAVKRYPGIQVQTSALGIQQTIGWGTFKTGCNLVWYNGFKSSAQKAAAGKGGTVTTGYNYTADLIVGIMEGPIDAITTVYIDSNTYTNGPSVADPSGKGTALQQANLNFASGAVGQAVWSYLTSKYPSQAIGYSGLAIAYQSGFALDDGASTPNFSFEIVKTSSFGVSGTPDADPSLVMTDFFENSRTGVPSWPLGVLDPVTLAQYQDYCLAAGLLLSPVINEERSASDFLTEVGTATNSTFSWSEGLLKFWPYGDTTLTGNGKTYTPNITPVYDLDEDDYIPKSDGEDPLLVDIEDQSDAYNVVQFEYLDRTNSYNPAIATGFDQANIEQFGERRQDPTTVHVICTPAVANQSVQLFLQRTLYIRKQFKFTLGWQFALLEPGDILALSYTKMQLVNYPVRIIQIDEGEAGESGETYDLICEELLIGTAHAPLYTMQNSLGQGPGTNVDPGGVEANLLTFSDSPANAAWTKTNTSITANSTTDQYGLTLASTLVTNTSAGVHGVSQSFAAFSGQNYIGACCVEAASLNNYRLTLSDGSGNGAYLEFNAATGAIITAPTAIGTGIAVAGAVNPTLVSGIWQPTLTVQVAASTLVLELDVNSSGNAHSWTPGSAISAGFVSQFQLRQGVAIGVYAATGAAIAGPILFNPPAVLPPAGVQGAIAVAGGPNWGGCDVWTSIDGTNYAFAFTINASARYGILTTSLPATADPDTTDTWGIDLGASAGLLTSASDATADNGGTLCLIDAGGTSELVCFSTATLTNPSRYSASAYTRRGYLNSGVASHAAGTTFVRLDDAIFDLPYFETNIAETVSVKFCSFNPYGLAIQSLSAVRTYTFVPNPKGATSPASSAWTATGTTLSNAGQAIPAIQIIGASDNPSATSIEFDYRVTGTTAWSSGGSGGPQTTLKFITAVQPSQTYDVSVLYIVNGVPSNREIIATGITTGSVATGASPGSTLLNDSAIGSGKTFTTPPGSYSHVDIVLTAAAGSGNTSGGSKSGTTDHGGGAGGTVVVAGFPCVPGAVLTYTLAAQGSAVSCTATGLNISANSGTNATTGASGTGGTATFTTGTGSSSNSTYTGHNGGLTDTWDGGGAWLPTNATTNVTAGGYTDNTNDGTPGSLPGQGGAGSFAMGIQPGDGCIITIIARA